MFKKRLIIFILATFLIASLSYASLSNDGGDESIPRWFFPIDHREIFNPILAQLDQSTPKQEVVVTSGRAHSTDDDFAILGLRPDRANVPNWDPLTIIDWEPVLEGISDVPVMGDIDGDGEIDIVVSLFNEFYAFNAHGQLKWKTPEDFYFTSFTPSALADLDQDGDREIIFGHMGNVVIYQGNGTFYKPDEWLKGFGARVIDQTPAVGDVDGNGSTQIAVCAVNEFKNGPTQAYLLNEDASEYGGDEHWPAEMPHTDRGGVKLADINQDGRLDLVVYGFDILLEKNFLYVFNRFGELFPGEWPIIFENSGENTGAIMADIDQDFPGLEIIFGISKPAKVYAFHWDGTSVEGWPFEGKEEEEFRHAPVAGDINGDGKQDICFASVALGHGGEVYFLSAKGHPQFETPFELPDYYQPIAQMAMGDPDLDKKTEIFMPLRYPDAESPGYLMMVEVSVGKTGVMQWPQEGGKASEHTNAFGRVFAVGSKAKYKTIASAVAEASNGDTIFVFGGTYKENIDLPEGVNLIGGNADRVIIESPNSLPAILVGSFSLLKNVSVVAPNATGIQVKENSPAVFIRNAIVRGSLVGIEVSAESSARIANVTVYNNKTGIHVQSDGQAQILNSIFGSNEGLAVSADTGSSAEIAYTDLYQDRVGANVVLREGMINADPQFIDVQVNNFYYNKQSPARDKGQPGYPYYEEPQTEENEGIDLGAFGGTKDSSENNNILMRSACTR